jgi:hypothetical protein
MAVNPNNRRGQRQAPYQNWAQNYASSISQAFNPAIEAVRSRLGAYLSPEQIEANVGGMFSGALQSAGQIGERSGAVTNQLTSNLVSGLSNLPGLDPNAIPLAISRAGTSTASAAVMGEAMRSQVELARALAIQQAKARREEGMASENERLSNLIMQQEQTKTDWMPYAQQRQGMRTTSLNNQQIVATLRMVPLERRNAVLSNMLLNAQVSGEQLSNKALRAKLKDLGVTFSDDTTDPDGGDLPAKPES